MDTWCVSRKWCRYLTDRVPYIFVTWSTIGLPDGQVVDRKSFSHPTIQLP
jgi:hypothetical protein